MTAFRELVDAMVQGRKWSGTGDADKTRKLLDSAYKERYHAAAHHFVRYQTRVNLQNKDDAASYAGWITAENPSSGPYQGTSFVWMPGTSGSVAVLVIGTDGFGSDTHILGRPGHARRLQALNRLHKGKLWVKPDLLDLNSRVPEAVSREWPEIPAALHAYGHVIYAALPVNTEADQDAVADLLDLFFFEHQTPLTGSAKARWDKRLRDISGAIFPAVEAKDVEQLLHERRYVVLEGPPGTGKTRLAYEVARNIGSSTKLQFHPARTYEDFVVGLFPKPVTGGLAFEVRAGDLLRANEQAQKKPHLLVLDEINRADLSRVLGESIVLFEPGENREVELPHDPPGLGRTLRLSPQLMVLGTRNTADRTIARMDIAIRRRFAFLEVWPDRRPVDGQEVPLAIEAFDDTVQTFAEHADAETLRLIPGQAYFLDPQPEGPPKERSGRVARKLKYELVPLLRDYLSERLGGSAGEEIAGLADRIESRLFRRE
jgi:5-methylcytosine-specific restriction protein B